MANRPTLSLKPKKQDKPDKPAYQPPSHQAKDLMKISGLPAVRALFTNRPDDVERLFYEDRLRTEAGTLCKQMADRRKPYRMVEAAELAKIAGTPLHGGIVAVAHPKPLPHFGAEQAALWAKAGKPLLLLDGVGNPHNLGAILRSMAFFGLDQLLISDHPDQAGISDATQRVAEGGVDWVTVSRAPFPASLELLKQAGYRVVATALTESAQPLAKLARDKPLALVLGNEEIGLPPASIAACTDVVRLEGAGQVQSLNVAATAAILVWELTKARP